MKISSFPPISTPEATVLILGTMPGEKSLQLKQYYGHKQNAFWKLMFAIFNESFSDDYETKKALLNKNKLAVWDVLEGCLREGSADSAIVQETPNDFETFFKNHPHIRLIAFNGQKAAAFYKKHVGISADFTFVTLPSTSPAHAAKNFETKLAQWKIISDKA